MYAYESQHSNGSDSTNACMHTWIESGWLFFFCVFHVHAHAHKPNIETQSLVTHQFSFFFPFFAFPLCNLQECAGFLLFFRVFDVVFVLFRQCYSSFISFSWAASQWKRKESDKNSPNPVIQIYIDMFVRSCILFEVGKKRHGIQRNAFFSWQRVSPGSSEQSQIRSSDTKKQTNKQKMSSKNSEFMKNVRRGGKKENLCSRIKELWMRMSSIFL